MLVCLLGLQNKNCIHCIASQVRPVHIRCQTPSSMSANLTRMVENGVETWVWLSSFHATEWKWSWQSCWLLFQVISVTIWLLIVSSKRNAGASLWVWGPPLPTPGTCLCFCRDIQLLTRLMDDVNKCRFKYSQNDQMDEKQTEWEQILQQHCMKISYVWEETGNRI